MAKKPTKKKSPRRTVKRSANKVGTAKRPAAGGGKVQLTPVVVAIGASAGGLAALEELFAARRPHEYLIPASGLLPALGEPGRTD